MSSSINSINAEAFREAVFFSLSISRWGNRAKVKDTSKLAEYLAMLNAKEGESTAPIQSSVTTESKAKSTKQLIRSTALDNLNEFLNQTKAGLCGTFGKANPSKIKEGLFVVKKTLVQEFEDTLAAALKEVREKHVPALLDEYGTAIENARSKPVKEGGLGPIFDAKDYPAPEELEQLFGLDWQWLALGVPEDLPAALRAQAAEKLEKQFTEAADEVKTALRVAFQELISHAVDRLTPGEDGKPRVFRNSLLENIQGFIDVFEARNIMSDDNLRNLVDKAQEILIGVNPDDLRKQEDVRKATAEKFAEVKQALDGMVETVRGRALEID